MDPDSKEYSRQYRPLDKWLEVCLEISIFTLVVIQSYRLMSECRFGTTAHL